MLGIKILIYSLIFLTCSAIGILKSQKYTHRVNELKEFKNGLNMFKTKIRFTYEPLPEIFKQTSRLVSENISKIFVNASKYMKEVSCEDAWNRSVSESNTYLNKEDIENIKGLGKLLGKTDKEGQISHLELTKTFIEMQIKKAKDEEEKNAKMYKTLGVIFGLAIVIILI